jgi:hypothetical protein
MAVFEMSLGLTGNMTGLLGNRRTLIVEGGDDALLIDKLSAVLRRSGKEGLSDSIYLWLAQGAPKTTMYAAFAIGQGRDSGVLLELGPGREQCEEGVISLFVHFRAVRTPSAAPVAGSPSLPGPIDRGRPALAVLD